MVIGGESPLFKETFLFNRKRSLEKTTTQQNAGLWTHLKGYVNKTLTPQAPETLWKGLGEKIESHEDEQPASGLENLKMNRGRCFIVGYRGPKAGERTSSVLLLPVGRTSGTVKQTVPKSVGHSNLKIRGEVRDGGWCPGAIVKMLRP